MSAKSTWPKIVREYESGEVGPALAREIEQRTRAFIRAHSYPPRVYAGVDDWADGIEDLVQDVQLTLIEKDQRQLHWVMDRAGNLDEFRRLLAGPIRITLRSRIRRTVLDNLRDRCKNLLEDEPFRPCGRIGRERAFALREVAEVRQATHEEVLRAARRVACVPTTPPEAGQRSPSVYTTENLRVVLEAIGESLEHGFTLRDAELVLREVLPSWFPSFLEDEVDLHDLQVSPISSVDEVLARDAAAELVATVQGGEREVLRLRLEGVPPGELARTLGVSRPTERKRRDEADGRLRAALAHLSPAAQQRAIELVSLWLAGMSKEPG